MYGVLSVTAPIYLLIVAGFLATRFGLFERADMRVFGKYTINLALPALLFNALSQRQVGEILTPLFIAAYLGGSLIVMVAGIVWARRVAGKDLPLSAVIGMGMACPNSGFIGFPLVAQVFGPSTAGVALALAMFVENFFLIPIALAIADSGGGEGVQGSRLARWRVAMMQSLRTVVRNPMIHGLVLGFLFSLLQWRLPEPMARAVGLLAASCSAIALLVIGGSLVARHQPDPGGQAAAASAGGAVAGDAAATHAARAAGGGGDDGSGASNGHLSDLGAALRARRAGGVRAAGVHGSLVLHTHSLAVGPGADGLAPLPVSLPGPRPRWPVSGPVWISG